MNTGMHLFPKELNRKHFAGTCNAHTIESPESCYLYAVSRNNTYTNT